MNKNNFIQQITLLVSQVQQPGGGGISLPNHMGMCTSFEVVYWYKTCWNGIKLFREIFWDWGFNLY